MKRRVRHSHYSVAHFDDDERVRVRPPNGSEAPAENGPPIRFSPKGSVDSTKGEFVEYVVRCNTATAFRPIQLVFRRIYIYISLLDRFQRGIAHDSRPSFFDATKIPGRLFQLFWGFVQGRLCFVLLVSFARAKSPPGHPQPYLRSADSFVYFLFYFFCCNYCFFILSVSTVKRNG